MTGMGALSRRKTYSVDVARRRLAYLPKLHTRDTSAPPRTSPFSEQDGTAVTLSYRGAEFSRIRAKNAERLELAQQLGQVNVLRQSHVTSITAESVMLEVDSEGSGKVKRFGYPPQQPDQGRKGPSARTNCIDCKTEAEQVESRKRVF